MGGRTALALILLVLVAPLATATDPTRDQVCVDQDNCAGPGMCTEFGCVPTACQPTFSCRAQVALLSQECATNMTISGETCQFVLAASAGTNAPGTGAGAGVALTQGNVDAFNLPNTWVTPTAEADGTALGSGPGHFSAGVYRSDITTEGPRNPPMSLLTTDDSHQWSQIAVVVHHDGGPAGGEHVVIALILLDNIPDGCYARTSAPGAPAATCPRFQPLV